MAKYIDCALIPLPKKNVEKYKEMASMMGKIFKDNGALHYYENLAEDLDSIKQMGGNTFPNIIKVKEDEVIIMAFIVFNSKEEREIIKAKVMGNLEFMSKMEMPFEMNRMVFAGFENIVEY
ncbi:MAG: DUF1428 domain-containing protein [Nanoarchaeota archaeon]|nr:DUF1428 domain-containing protein [Nanoarchaeota archaeon]